MCLTMIWHQMTCTSSITSWDRCLHRGKHHSKERLSKLTESIDWLKGFSVISNQIIVFEFTWIEDTFMQCLPVIELPIIPLCVLIFLIVYSSVQHLNVCYIPFWDGHRHKRPTVPFGSIIRQSPDPHSQWYTMVPYQIIAATAAGLMQCLHVPSRVQRVTL